MSAASNYTETNVINALLRGVPFPIPSGIYVSLHTGDPGEDGANEVSPDDWPAYVRKDAAVGGDVSWPGEGRVFQNSREGLLRWG